MNTLKQAIVDRVSAFPDSLEAHEVLSGAGSLLLAAVVSAFGKDVALRWAAGVIEEAATVDVKALH